MQLSWLKPRRGFRHGVHPPDEKATTRGLAIRQFPFAPVLMLPLSQHAGKPAVPVLREGQEVLRGQLLARADGWMSAPLHAPATGTVLRIAPVASVSGKWVDGIYLQPLPGSTQEVVEGLPCPLTSSPEQIIQAIQDAGIVGLGGAAFPTHVKLRIPPDKHVDYVILNGVECEPYLSTDHRVMLEQTEDIFVGLRYLLRATGAARALIGVEANKADAASALRAQAPQDIAVGIELLPVKYPQGAEKMLIKALLDREVPSGGLPLDVHCVVVNVATAAEIGRLLPHGRGIQERVVTLAGSALARPGNYRIPIGTPLRFALEHAGVSPQVATVFAGGPMMGQAVASLDVPITKGTSGVVALLEGSNQTRIAPSPCIHCGRCLDACPMLLNPCQLGVLARQEQFATMATEFHLGSCFECGACSFVCPAHIPLVQYFRIAKAALRKREATP
jgi:electron transport complex protein RnfC